MGGCRYNIRTKTRYIYSLDYCTKCILTLLRFLTFPYIYFTYIYFIYKKLVDEKDGMNS